MKEHEAIFLDYVNQGIIKVTKEGKIFNTKTNREIGYKNNCGYIGLGIKINKKVHHMLAHRLVYMVYISNDIDPKLTINHKNGIKTDNRVDNLELVTYAANNKHAKETGLYNGCTEKGKEKLRVRFSGEKSTSAKIKNEDIPDIKMMRRNGRTYQEIATIYNVHRSTIRNTAIGKSFKNV